MGKGIGDWKGNRISAAILLAAGVAAGMWAGVSFLDMREEEALYPSPGLTQRALLSDYFPGVKDTPGDTDVFVYEGEEAGASVLVLGGTHANEAAGFITALLLVENLTVRKGKVVVIPRANSSAFTSNEPQEGNPQRYSIEVTGGRRSFRLGSRATNPIDQWPDPTLFETPAGQIVSGPEARNLNRCYPGRADGNLTERIAYGIMEVIRQEGITIGIDLHESSPEYPVINAIVFHENSAEVAAVAQMNLQFDGLDLRLEASPQNLRGLSHREWGDAAGIRAFLLETPNPVQGRLKGRPTAELVVGGKDKFYLKAEALGRLFIPYTDEGIPISVRVARHLGGIQAILGSLEEMEPDQAVVLEGLPSWTEVQERGVGAFLGHPDG
ncbi:MAG: succinylglutamate desuccinylase/aspartoacylase family protein [Gemmatimonadota bacterium]